MGINNEKLSEYNEWAKVVQGKLRESRDWVEQYGGYAKGLLANEKAMIDYRSSFKEINPLAYYVTTGNMKDGKPIFDIRYLGQSVGEIHIKDGEPHLYVKGDKYTGSKEYFGYDKENNGIIDGKSWRNSKEADEFRKFYKEKVDKNCIPKQIEHMVESRLFQEFEKDAAVDKQLVGIRTIKFANCFFHMKTCLVASGSKDKKVNVVGTGGEIDIFCRRRIGNENESRLTVIEVKDKSEKNESFEEAMFQAISYTVFISELIHSDYGEEWAKIWDWEYQYKKYIQSGFTLNAVVAIPVGKKEIPDFIGDIITLDNNDTIALHYIAINESVSKPDGKLESLETSL